MVDGRADVRRYALVIGSQCDGLGEAKQLSFLPDLAVDLYNTLTDPLLGACKPALAGGPDAGLLLNPDRATILAALEGAFNAANAHVPERNGSH